MPNASLDKLHAILKIIARFTSKNRQLSLGANVNVDLHVYGDDAWEMLEKISANFDIDFTNFDFERYFYTEEEMMIAPYFVLVPFLQKKKPLSISHLLAVVERGHWFDPK